MLLTEKEAKEKWCPHVRIAVLAGHGGAACNTHPDPYIDADCRCAGSRCAMWRWSEPRKARRAYTCDDTTATTDPGNRPGAVPADWCFEPHDAAEGDPAAWVEPEDQANLRRRGYCGLAGKPREG